MQNNQEKLESSKSSNFVARDDSANNDRSKSSSRFGNFYKKKNFFFKKRVCIICQKNLEFEVEYKNTVLLRRFISDKGRILPRRLSGNCMRHQRFARRAIQQSRVIALLWFTAPN